MKPPVRYSRELTDAILERYANGETLTRILRSGDPSMPHMTSWCDWIDRNEDGLADRYKLAKRAHLEGLSSEILDISDDGRNDTYETEDGEERVNHDHIQRSKLRVDSRKWLLSKLAADVYGDKVSQEISGPGGGAFTVNVVAVPTADRKE